MAKKIDPKQTRRAKPLIKEVYDYAKEEYEKKKL